MTRRALLLLALVAPAPGQAQPAGGASAGPTQAAPAGRVQTAPEAFWEALRLDNVGGLQTQMLRGAGANAQHPEHGPAIVVAARERSPKVLAYLAGLSGTRIDATNSHGETALMLVALQGDLDSAKLLVGRGAEVNRKGWTPLHYAAAGGQLPTITYLLEENAYIDAQSPNGTTPLMMAARQKHTTATRFLVEAGADPSPRNESGYTAADYMAAHGEKAEANWLRERADEFVRRYGTVEKPRPAGGGAETSSAAGALGGPAGPEGPASSKVTASPHSSGSPEATTTPVPPRPRLPGSRD